MYRIMPFSSVGRFPLTYRKRLCPHKQIAHAGDGFSYGVCCCCSRWYRSSSRSSSLFSTYDDLSNVWAYSILMIHVTRYCVLFWITDTRIHTYVCATEEAYVWCLASSWRSFTATPVTRAMHKARNLLQINVTAIREVYARPKIDELLSTNIQ